MRRVLIVLGVLGSGTAVTFLAAAAIFLVNPNGHLVANNYQGNPVPVMKGGPIALPVPAAGVVVDDTGAVVAPSMNQVVIVPDKRGIINPPRLVVPAQSGTAP